MLSHCSYVRFVCRMQAFASKEKLPPSVLSDFVPFVLRRGLKLSLLNEYVFLVPRVEDAYSEFLKYESPVYICPVDSSRLFQFLCAQFAVFMRGAYVSDPMEIMIELNKPSSPGEPWVTQHHYSTKSSVLIAHPELLANPCAEMPKCLWKGLLKKEIRKAGKAARLFLGGPIEHNICGIKLFASMLDNLISHNGDHPSILGTSKFHGGWQRMLLRLCCGRPVEDVVVHCLDFSKWDSKFPRFIMEIIKEFKKLLLNDEHDAEVEWFYSQILHAWVYLPYGDVVEMCQGNTSGSYQTALDNTLGVWLMYAIAFIWFNPSGSTYEMMTEWHLLICGDDHLLSYSNGKTTKPSCSQLVKFFATLGCTLKVVRENCPLIEAEFLSQVTTKTPYGLMPQPETAKVLCSMYRKTNHEDFFMTVLRALSLRTDSFWNKEAFNVLDDYVSHLFLQDQYRLMIDKEKLVLQAIYLTPRELLELWTNKQRVWNDRIERFGLLM